MIAVENCDTIGDKIRLPCDEIRPDTFVAGTGPEMFLSEEK